MEEKDKIAIIVPVYNVKNYLKKCIESILNQTYSNLEIILVDDGSTDGSGKICDDYSFDERILVLHKRNEGLSIARNTGVAVSEAKYIMFVDSDDYISIDCVEYLYHIMNKHNADISMGFCPAVKIGEDYKRKTDIHDVCLDSEKTLEKMCYKDEICNSAWGKLYKRELVQKYPYPAGWIFEDLATTYKIIGDCKKIAIGSKDIYYYVQRDDSIVHKNMNENMFMGIEAAENQLQYIKKNFPNIIEAAEYFYVYKIIQFIPNIIKNNDLNKGYYRRLKKYLKKYSKKVFRNLKTKKSVKIRIFALSTNYRMTQLIGKLIILKNRRG